MLKRCRICSGAAELSLVSIVSTLGIKPRSQKCSPAVLFCRKCLQEHLSEDGHSVSKAVWESVYVAYAQINGHSTSAVNQGCRQPLDST